MASSDDEEAMSDEEQEEEEQDDEDEEEEEDEDEEEDDNETDDEEYVPSGRVSQPGKKRCVAVSSVGGRPMCMEQRPMMTSWHSR